MFQDIFGKQREGTIMAACDCDGSVTWACEWIQGTMDSDRFVRWEQDALCPVLGQFVPGEKHPIVILDVVKQHHDERVVRAIEGAGAEVIYLPRYSPDFSPIELGFAHLKKALKKASKESPKSDVQFQARLFACLEEWTQKDARTCFRKCLFDVPLVRYEEEDLVGALAALAAVVSMDGM